MIDSVLDDAAVARVWPAILPWQADTLRDALRGRATWPHALLITGAAGIGKRRLAMEFAHALLCESPRADGMACGACDGCRYVAAGQHPDLRVIEAVDVDEDGTVTPAEWIRVDAIRAMIDWVQLTSHRRGAKVAVIAPAERMRLEAANALLKTLEEPPENSHLILVSHQPGRLPPTVRSRCRVLAAPLPEPSVAHDWLVREGIAAPEALLAQAGGAPLSALALADPGYQAGRAVWLRALALPKALVPAALAGRIDMAAREERKERLGAAIDWTIAWCADLAAVQAGGEARRNRDFVSAIAKLASSVAPLALFRYHRSLLRQRGLLSHPLTPRLVAEALLFEYLTMFG